MYNTNVIHCKYFFKLFLAAPDNQANKIAKSITYPEINGQKSNL